MVEQLTSPEGILLRNFSVSLPLELAELLELAEQSLRCARQRLDISPTDSDQAIEVVLYDDDLWLAAGYHPDAFAVAGKSAEGGPRIIFRLPHFLLSKTRVHEFIHVLAENESTFRHEGVAYALSEPDGFDVDAWNSLVLCGTGDLLELDAVRGISQLPSILYRKGKSVFWLVAVELLLRKNWSARDFLEAPSREILAAAGDLDQIARSFENWQASYAHRAGLATLSRRNLGIEPRFFWRAIIGDLIPLEEALKVDIWAHPADARQKVLDSLAAWGWLSSYYQYCEGKTVAQIEQAVDLVFPDSPVQYLSDEQGDYFRECCVYQLDADLTQPEIVRTILSSLTRVLSDETSEDDSDEPPELSALSDAECGKHLQSLIDMATLIGHLFVRRASRQRVELLFGEDIPDGEALLEEHGSQLTADMVVLAGLYTASRDAAGEVRAAAEIVGRVGLRSLAGAPNARELSPEEQQAYAATGVLYVEYLRKVRQHTLEEIVAMFKRGELTELTQSELQQL